MQTPYDFNINKASAFFLTTIYSKKAIKFLKETDKSIRDKIFKGILGLTEIPPVGDIKALQGRDNELRLRISKYRIIYQYQNNNLMILDIGSRGDIYKYEDIKMSEITSKTIELLEMLPENEQLFVLEFIRKLVLAWDPDYTKLTEDEKSNLEESLKGPFMTHEQLIEQLNLK